jgi:hypothetical protein
MALIFMADHWVPTKVHGSIEVPKTGFVDVEKDVAVALKDLLPASQIPSYTDIKYRVVAERTIADENGSSIIIAGDTNILFFELI